jgi:hypothetical protein
MKQRLFNKPFVSVWLRRRITQFCVGSSSVKTLVRRVCVLATSLALRATLGLAPVVVVSLVGVALIVSLARLALDERSSFDLANYVATLPAPSSFTAHGARPQRVDEGTWRLSNGNATISPVTHFDELSYTAAGTRPVETYIAIETDRINYREFSQRWNVKVYVSSTLRTRFVHHGVPIAEWRANGTITGVNEQRLKSFIDDLKDFRVEMLESGLHSVASVSIPLGDLYAPRREWFTLTMPDLEIRPDFDGHLDIRPVSFDVASGLY